MRISSFIENRIDVMALSYHLGKTMGEGCRESRETINRGHLTEETFLGYLLVVQPFLSNARQRDMQNA
jgi:hypothetical protein